MTAARELLQQLTERRDLTQPQAEELLGCLTDAELSPALAGALLGALATKGLVAAEVRGFAQAMRRLAARPQLPAGVRAIDIVGTGGDASGSVNISTGTALLAAACGLKVVKHGNRSISSRCGSADVLEALGLSIPADPPSAIACLERHGFTFLFAPHYHRATRNLAPIRAALGVRTVFNVLGPLVNPAQPPLHLVGAFDLPMARLIAETFQGLPGERTFVVHGAAGWDEPTPVGPFTLFDVRAGSIIEQQRTPQDYGLATCRAAELAGGDAAHNARALREVLCGEQRGAHRDCLLLGAALALELAGEVGSAREGMARAAHAIDSGAARRLLTALMQGGTP